ncbi:MAG: hypothetical protein LBR73_04910 [Oscillospiraceae bacterium]|nr:hypothetical protein [Oscillospiraceae bacterium]
MTADFEEAARYISEQNEEFIISISGAEPLVLMPLHLLTELKEKSALYLKLLEGEKAAADGDVQPAEEALREIWQEVIDGTV